VDPRTGQWILKPARPSPPVATVSTLTAVVPVDVTSKIAEIIRETLREELGKRLHAVEPLLYPAETDIIPEENIEIDESIIDVGTGPQPSLKSSSSGIGQQSIESTDLSTSRSKLQRLKNK
jgi:hypothetical protein